MPTSSLESLKLQGTPELEVLPHIQMRISADGRVGLKGPSVVGHMAQFDGQSWRVHAPQDAEGYYWTQDCGEIKGSRFIPKGRIDDLKKVRGELVSWSQLQGRLDQILLSLGEALGPVICFLPDARLENKICLVMEPAKWPLAKQLKAAFKARSAPYERIESVYVIQNIPRSDLGKVKTGDLQRLLTPP